MFGGDGEHQPAANSTVVLLVEPSCKHRWRLCWRQTRALLSSIGELETDPFGTRTQCCRRIVDEKGKAHVQASRRLSI